MVKLIWGEICFMFRVLDIRFGDHTKMLITSETFGMCLLMVFESCVFICFYKFSVEV